MQGETRRIYSVCYSEHFETRSTVKAGELVAAGAIIGLRATVSMMIGAIALTWFVSPVALGAEWHNTAGALVTAATKPQTAWKEIGVWVGAPQSKHR